MNAYKNYKKRERDAETYKDEFYSAVLRWLTEVRYE